VLSSPFRLQRRWILLFAIGLILTVGSSIWRINAAPAPLAPALSPLPQDSHIQVFFNQSEASVYSDPYRHIERYGDNLEQVIISAIEQANSTVEVAVQDLNLPLVAKALVNSAQRGVSVRLVLENQYANPTSASAKAELDQKWMAIADGDRNGQLSPEEIAQSDALQILRSAHIPLIDDTADGSKGSGLMHHKFLIIDSQSVLTGSANFTLSDLHGDANEPASRGNANALLNINSPAVAARFREEFNQMWGDGPGAQPNSHFGLKKGGSAAHASAQNLPQPSRIALPTGNLTLQFSPRSPSQPWEQSTNGLITRTLSQAKHSIALALFVFSEQRIANPLEAQAQAGTDLRVLIDPGFAYRSYSEALDMLGIALLDQRCQIEANNHPWKTPIDSVGMPQLPSGDKLHHKFAVIDSKTVIVGSHNWSHAANTENDEALLVIDNATVAAHFEREFERLYRSPLIGNTAKLQHKIQENQARCR
jgi:phosphatidylserine/phosphatidylglycerophosphate/cardiolipin synthase-like enzyme